jgi:hypothetical protein
MTVFEIYEVNDEIQRLYKIQEKLKNLYVKFYTRNDILYNQYYFENLKESFNNQKYKLFVEHFKQIVDNHNIINKVLDMCKNVSKINTDENLKKDLHKYTNELLKYIDINKELYEKLNLYDYDYFYYDTLLYKNDNDYHIFKNTLKMYINTVYVNHFINNHFYEN